MVKLNKVCEINIGKTPSRSNNKFWENGVYNWISIRDLKSKYIVKTRESISEEAISDCNMKIIPKDTVIMSFKLSIGKVAITGKDVYSNEAIANFPVKDLSILSSKYLYYVLQTLKLSEKTDRAVMGATLNKKKLNDLIIPLPPIPTQIKIAAALDKAQELIDKRKEQIQKYDELLYAYYIKNFYADKDQNYKKIKISKLAKQHKNSMRTGPFGSNLLHSEFVDNGIPVLGIDNAVDNVFRWKKRRYITEDKYQKLKSYTVYPEDVIITIMGTCGRSAVVPKDISTCINTKHLACITLDKKIANPYFISYSFLKNPFILKQLSLKTRGAIMDGLNLTIIKEIEIYLPPVDLQNQFASIVEKIEDEKKKLETSLTELENNFNSIMQRSFKGELF
ncbi:restriction endonuclease subunit S [uncultured Ilyobacter sp.]|uniref:restriction endonuclease subunit S n=1 Tax=uncultured Ilyobacter sp. TaxID=544433 RepID=UPI003747E1D6